MNVKEFYEAIGGSYDTAVGRLMRDSMIEKFVNKFPKDPSFAALEQAVGAEDWEAAFSAAHTLKGVSLNLAFQTLGQQASELTEMLRPPRSGEPAAIKAQFAVVSDAYHKVITELTLH